MNCSTPGLPVHHQLTEPTQTHVHWVGDAIHPSHPLSSPSPPTFNLSHHQSLFKWVSSSHQVAKVLEFQLQHQSFQWMFRTDFLYDGLVESSCSPRDSQESSLTPQFKGISSSTFSFLYSLTFCDPMVCSTPGFSVHNQLLEFTQTHGHRAGDAMQPSHPLSSPSPPALNFFHHQSLFKWVSSSHQVAKYWSFSLSISPSNEYSGLISFRMDWWNDIHDVNNIFIAYSAATMRYIIANIIVSRLHYCLPARGWVTWQVKVKVTCF